MCEDYYHFYMMHFEEYYIIHLLDTGERYDFYRCILHKLEVLPRDVNNAYLPIRK